MDTVSQVQSEHSRRPIGLVVLLLTTIVGLGLDLWTKHLSITFFSPTDLAGLSPAEIAGRQSEIAFIPGYLHFTYVQNHGAVFGIGQGGRWIFVLVSFAAIAFVSYLYVKSPKRWWYDLTLGMLLAGILGNLYDRIFIGHVRDMIHALPRWPNLFPWIFNVADSLLCVSIGILLIAGFFLSDEAKSERKSSRN